MTHEQRNEKIESLIDEVSEFVNFLTENESVLWSKNIKYELEAALRFIRWAKAGN